MSLKRLVKIAFLLLPWSAAVAQPMAEHHDLSPGGWAVVERVSDGDTLRLRDGRRLRLVGVQAPERPQSALKSEIWPLADEAKTFLEDLVLGKKLRLFYGTTKQDRHRRILAHAVTEDGIWLQAALLRAGLAHVYTFPDNRDMAADLYPFEDDARNEGLGIWKTDYYQPLRAADMDGHGAQFAGRFRIVEGRIKSANNVRGRVYLNFGERWKSDFTVIIERRVARRMKASWVDEPKQLSGSYVQLRGWIDDENGPMIRLSHPEQLRFLNEQGNWQ